MNLSQIVFVDCISTSPLLIDVHYEDDEGKVQREEVNEHNVHRRVYCFLEGTGRLRGYPADQMDVLKRIFMRVNTLIPYAFISMSGDELEISIEWRGVDTFVSETASVKPTAPPIGFVHGDWVETTRQFLPEWKQVIPWVDAILQRHTASSPRRILINPRDPEGSLKTYFPKGYFK